MSTEWSADVDTSIFSPTAIMRAAYKFSGQFFVAVTRHNQHRDRIVVGFRERAPGPVESTNVIETFTNELLDQQIRESLEAEFGSLRELIVAQAFSDAPLVADGQDGDPNLDPLGISNDSPGPHVPSASLKPKGMETPNRPQRDK